jgi:hypothetical protein
MPRNITLPASLVIITFTLVTACNKPTDSAQLTPEIEKQVKGEVTALITEVNNAANNLDTDKFMSYFAPNVIFAFNGIVGEGREGVLLPHQRSGNPNKPKPNGWAVITPSIKTESEPLKITVVTSKAAVLTFARKSTIKMKEGGTRILSAAFTALVVKQDSNKWMIIQGHESTVPK